MTAEAILTTKGVLCSRNDRFLFSPIGFELYSGQLLELVGGNGSGKTTFLHSLLGLYPLSAGHIVWCGKSIFDCLARYHQTLSYLGHALAIKNDFTIREQLHWGWKRQPSESQIHELLDEFQLLKYINTFCRNLSRGQRQRVALIGVILSQAQLWFLDEPFTGLDHYAQHCLIAYFRFHLQKGGSIILTGHAAFTELKSDQIIHIKSAAKQ